MFADAAPLALAVRERRWGGKDRSYGRVFVMANMVYGCGGRPSLSSDCRLFDAANPLADVSLHESFSTFPDALPLCLSSSPSPSVEIPALSKLPDSRTALSKK